MNNNSTPFGMLFEEQAPEMPLNILIPEYDAHIALSFITDEMGRQVPFVENGCVAMATQTFTNVKKETTDADPGRPSTLLPGLPTGTETKIRAEETDSDYHPWLAKMQTQTFTEVKKEATDTDW